ncbi:MAG: hypothetical protein LAO04_16750 [Acidobacteriia bacterium]|nr:hypothetical protein [Terriglobia bacterium]
MIEEISLVWNVTDVKIVRPDLSKRQCSEILQAVETNHDATLGVNWDTLEYWAEDLYPLAKLQRARLEKWKADDERDWETHIGDSFRTLDKIWKKSGLKISG